MNKYSQYNSSIITRDTNGLSDKSGNLYRSVALLGKRARQISANLKEELSNKLAEFASTVDNLEEVFENREQIEISKFYERLPKPTGIAMEEFLADELNWHSPDADNWV